MVWATLSYAETLNAKAVAEFHMTFSNQNVLFSVTKLNHQKVACSDMTFVLKVICVTISKISAILGPHKTQQQISETHFESQKLQWNLIPHPQMKK